MKILLLGKSGLLGQALFRVFSQHHVVEAPSREQCDITRPDDLKAALSAHPFDLILNAAGYTDVDRAETDRDAAFLVNAAGAGHLAKTAQKKNIPLVHFSTDFVFDGTKKEGYGESDAPAPLSVYGQSKAAGEREILSRLKSFYLIRTSWLFGPGTGNFVEKMIRRAHDSNGKPIRVVDDQEGCPTFTLDLAQAVLLLLETKTYGVYHIVNSGSATRCQWAVEIFRQLGIPQPVIPVTSASFPAAARRPAHSILLNTKTVPLRPWQQALEAYLMKKTLIL